MSPVIHHLADTNQTTPTHINCVVPGERLFSMSGVTLRVWESRILADTNWEVRAGENWAVIGPNGAGKTTLMRTITGQVPVVAGVFERHHSMATPESIGYVSFEAEQRLIDREMARDEARYFSGKANDLLRVKDTVLNTRSDINTPQSKIDNTIKSLDLEHLWNREVRQLSSGELRRVFVTRALIKSEGLLILDEPFEGLDTDHRRNLSAILDTLMNRGVQVILVSHRIDEIPHGITRIIALKKGRVFGHGLRKTMLAQPHFIDELYGAIVEPTQPIFKSVLPGRETDQPIIDIRNATVRYGALTVFENLSWRANKGENWAIHGANGSGKTTLLRLITGDHLQAYANEIYLFGRRRGTGESIWEIKKRFGVVSAELQRHYRKRIPALNVVRSGFFDSIGLYRSCTLTQQDLADEWIQYLDLTALMNRRYDRLSFGERKMVLITRSMVKSPEVLILDEPCQGLDPNNRRRVLDLVNRIGQTTDTQIIFVTHRPDEVPACTSHFFKMPSLGKTAESRSG